MVAVPASAEPVACAGCREGFEVLFVRPPFTADAAAAAPGARPSGRAAMVVETAPSKWGPCTNHRAVPAAGKCRECQRPICAVCRLELPQGRYCPDCATRPVNTGGGTTKAVLSVGLAVASCVTFFGLMAWAATAGDMSPREAQRFQVIDALVTKGVTVAASAGVMLGFISTDEGRKNILGVVGIVINLLILGVVMLLLIFVAMGGGK